MSNELSKMQTDGLLTTTRNHFVLRGKRWEDYMELKPVYMNKYPRLKRKILIFF
jgi:hypothetical protein